MNQTAGCHARLADIDHREPVRNDLELVHDSSQCHAYMLYHMFCAQLAIYDKHGVYLGTPLFESVRQWDAIDACDILHENEYYYERCRSSFFFFSIFCC